MGRAEDLFDRLEREGEAAIDNFILDRQVEDLFLDFKRSATNGAGRTLHQDDRGNLAKAISGFGNSEGGVIVWGVDCARQASVGDVASAKLPIENPARFMSWLQGAVSGCTVPPHPGVHHIAIQSATGFGFAVTLVPQSYMRPHQCVRPVQYYIRAGSDFVPAPHGLLMGLFGRPPQPFVFHRWAFSAARCVQRQVQGLIPALLGHGADDVVASFDVDFVLSSFGPGLARDLYVTLKILPPGPNSGFAFDCPETDHWRGSAPFGGARWQVYSTDLFKLSPGAVTVAFRMRALIGPPFDRALRYELQFGHGQGPTRSLEGQASPNALQAAFDELRATRGSGDEEAVGHRFVNLVMSFDEARDRAIYGPNVPRGPS